MRDGWFEWDDAKAKRNWLKHRVRFEDARRAFDDPFSVDFDDAREDYGEDRFGLAGYVDGTLLIVAYTYREDRVRIISARGAEPHEKRRYAKANERR